MWKNIVELGRPQMTVWRMRNVCWMSKTTSTHSEYVTLIAFLLQQLLHERASVLRYMYTACHVFSVSVCTHLAYSVCLLHLSFYVAFKCFQLAYSPAPTPTLPPISCSPPFRVILIMCKPCAMCSSVNRWLLRLAVTDCTSRVHVSGYHLYLCRFNNMSIRVQITCVFFLTYYCECTWDLSPMKSVISETYCDVQTESLRQVLFSTGVQVSCTAWEGRAVGSVGQTASLFHQMPSCRLKSAYETYFVCVCVIALLVITRGSSFKWQLMSII